MKYFLLVYFIGYVGYFLFNLKRVGKIEETIEEGGFDSYFKVTVWWIMIESILWFMFIAVSIFCNIIRPSATEEEYNKQHGDQNK